MIVQVAAGGVAIVVVMVVVVFTQPAHEWHDGAEHSRRFWVAWIAASCVVAALGPALLGRGAAGAAWVATFVAVGALQPALIADIVDARCCSARRRVVAVVPVAAIEAPLRPIRWRAPEPLDPGRDRRSAPLPV